MKLSGKKVLVIGLGESGLAMATWAAREGAAVRVADSRSVPPNADALRRAAPAAELVAGPLAGTLLDGIDLVALSPGVALQTPLVQHALARGLPVVSEIELFAWAVRERVPASKIIAITGSNGKTTTTALTAALLNSIGVTAVACGNISPSALDALMAVLDADESYHSLPQAWVLELSSYQLETTYTLDAAAATLLNVSEDHLDRYAGIDAYALAKGRIFEGGPANAVRVLNRDDARSLAWQEAGRTVTFGLDRPQNAGDYGIADGFIVRGGIALVALHSIKLVGTHNAANAMAALALCEAIGVAPQRLVPALASFAGLPHRVEWVATVGGVSYYDDSKGTNVGATLAALQGLGRPVAIILGGEGKAQDFSPLKAALARHACAVALIGRDAPLIAAAIEGCGVVTQTCADLPAAVEWCAGRAQPGDAVLLSPACASFDMFRNYGHRAEVFVNAVRALEARERGGR
jgi:UDP-N-acetylmuramoylalanine--D-glutamate ligase